MFLSAATVGKDNIIVSGGLSQVSGFFVADIYQYSLSTSEWKDVGQLPKAKYGHASIYFEDKVWIIGGQHEGEDIHSSCVEIMDPISFEIMRGPDTQVPRIWCRLFVINKRLYAVGGDSLVSKCIPTIEVYDSSNQTWQVLLSNSTDSLFRMNFKSETMFFSLQIVTNFPAPRKLFSSVVIGRSIYIFGGKDETYCNIRTYDVFDVETHSWRVADVGPGSSSQV